MSVKNYSIFFFEFPSPNLSQNKIGIFQDSIAGRGEKVQFFQIVKCTCSNFLSSAELLALGQKRTALTIICHTIYIGHQIQATNLAKDTPSFNTLADIHSQKYFYIATGYI